MAQLVASVSGVVLGGVAEVVGSNLARGKIFTASIGSVDSLYPSVYKYIYVVGAQKNCLNEHPNHTFKSIGKKIVTILRKKNMDLLKFLLFQGLFCSNPREPYMKFSLQIYTIDSGWSK